MKLDIQKANTPTLVLAVLADGPRHGYAIAREIERRSERALKLREGALYPILRVLEQDGLVAGDWELPGSGPARKVYVITEAGRGELERQARAWRRFVKAIDGVMGGLPDAEPA
jgi:PadR family transcriptional regulator PadR